MKGSPQKQVETLFYISGINQIGRSKHKAKEAARDRGHKTWHDVGKQLGIHSYKTAEAYRDVWTQCFQYAKDHFKVKKLERLSGEHVKQFLQSKIDQKIAYATFQQYSSGMEKLETALRGYAEKYRKPYVYQFSSAIREVRKIAQTALNKDQDRRAYKNPETALPLIISPKKLGCPNQFCNKPPNNWRFAIIAEVNITGITEA